MTFAKENTDRVNTKIGSLSRIIRTSSFLLGIAITAPIIFIGVVRLSIGGIGGLKIISTDDVDPVIFSFLIYGALLLLPRRRVRLNILLLSAFVVSAMFFSWRCITGIRDILAERNSGLGWLAILAIVAILITLWNGIELIKIKNANKSEQATPRKPSD